MTDKKTQKKSKAPAAVTKKIVPPTPGRMINKIGIENGALAIYGTEQNQAAVDQAFGTGSRDFVAYGMLQLANFISKSKDEDLTVTMNAAMAFLRSVGPTSEIETLLAVQMFATHHLAMDVTGRASRVSGLPQYEAHGNLSTKLMRTFTTQMEALNRHRRGGKQVVEHVHVNAGGQAVIAGSVTTGGRKHG